MHFGLVLLLMLLQVGVLWSVFRWLGGLLPHYFGGTLLVTAAMMVYLLNQDMDNSVRITWLVVTALMPVLGVPLFWYTKSDVGHNALKRRLLDLEGQTRAQLPQNEQTVELLQEQAPEAMPCDAHAVVRSDAAGTVSAGQGRRISGLCRHGGHLLQRRRSYVR